MGKKKNAKKRHEKAWKRATAALAACASQSNVHTAIDDMATLMHLASLRKAEADVLKAQHGLPDACFAQVLAPPLPTRHTHPPSFMAVEAGASSSGSASAAPSAPSSKNAPESPDCSSSAAKATSTHANFRRWLQDNGIDDEYYDIRASKVKGAGNGLFIRGADEVCVATRTVVVRVPSRLMISTLHINTPSPAGANVCDVAGSVAVNNGGGQEASQSVGLQWMFGHSDILSRQPSIQLALVLLHECFKGRRSFWFPYIATFPSSFADALPLWWSIDELSQLAGQSATLRSAARGIVSFARYYCHVDKLLAAVEAQPKSGSASIMPFPRTFFTLKNFRWAMSIVMTRQNPVPFKNASGQVSGRVLALVPVMDMANHDPSLDHGTFYDDETDEICVAASSALRGGDELRMYYGDRSNQEFLVHCGFVTDNNRHDKTTVLLSVHSDGDPFYKLRISVLSQQGIVGRQASYTKATQVSSYTQFELDILQGGVPSDMLITFCENMLLSKSELGSMLRAGAAQATPGSGKNQALAAALAAQPLDGNEVICRRVQARRKRVASYLLAQLVEVKQHRDESLESVKEAWPAAVGACANPLATKKSLQDQHLLELALDWCRNQCNA